MFRSDRFDRDLGRSLREHGNDVTDPAFQTRAEEMFQAHLRHLPQPFVGELFAYGIQQVEQESADISIFGELIDLLWQDYDDRNDPLTAEDWSILRDLVDEHAIDLDMQLVQYIMERIVAHGEI